MQRMLNFVDMPISAMQVWETLADEQRVLVLEVLAHLIVQATVRTPRSEEDHDR